MSQLTPNQVDEFARTVASLQQTIVGFYANPDNEKAFQEWYAKKYQDKESVL